MLVQIYTSFRNSSNVKPYGIGTELGRQHTGQPHDDVIV